MIHGDLTRDGWEVYPHDMALAHWVSHALPVAEAALKTTSDWRAGGTWAPGVDLLPNDAEGAVGQSGALQGRVIQRIVQIYGTPVWHRAQLSTICAGYPKAGPADTDAAARYRRNRDAAHLDGLLPIGPNRRRHLRELHAFVLGLPLTSQAESPLVVWEGSHHIMRGALAPLLQRDPDADLTDAYHAARKECFETCRRVALPVSAGQATLLHRLTLHGIAPWCGPSGPPRIIAYFRPYCAGAFDWIRG